MSQRTIRSVLATVTYDDAHRDRLVQIFAPSPITFVSPHDDAGIAEALKTVDVAVLHGDADDRYASPEQLKWVHCDHSGLNGTAREAILARTDLIVTGSAGRAAPALAQHIFYFALALTYDAPGLFEEKQRHAWRTLPRYQNLRGLYGKTIGIIGLGHTGRETVKIAKAMGMRAIGYGRGAEQAATPGLDVFYDQSTGDGIDELLKQSDYVALAVRLSDETFHMIGAEQLQLMKPTAYLINMARGSVVDEKALIAALRAGTIAGAGLDVFETEPLPADAAIWDAPNVMLTPHTTAEMPDLAGRSLDIIEENVRRYRSGEQLINRIGPGDLYTRGATARSALAENAATEDAQVLN